MVTALIAEDEPLLAAALKAELARAWPELSIVAIVGDGASAVAQALTLQPDVLFFDIQMPGLSGLHAAAELLDAWPAQSVDSKPVKAFPALVFVTAYDQYAVAAFEAQAMDYLLKPVQPARLLKTVQKVQLAQQVRAKTTNFSATKNIAYKNSVDEDPHMQQMLTQLRALLPAMSPPTAQPLQMISATLAGSQGNTLQMVPIAEVLYFEAADKYIRVLTANAEYLNDCVQAKKPVAHLPFQKQASSTAHPKYLKQACAQATPRRLGARPIAGSNVEHCVLTFWF